MKPLHWLVVLIALSIALSACSPVMIQSSSGEPSQLVVENQPAVSDLGYQPVDVEHVEAVVGVGSPIPIHVNVSGNLPDTCAQLELVQQKQEGSNFYYSLSTIPSSAEGCIQDLLPFRVSLPINAVHLPAGSYTVFVNGFTASFELNTGNTVSELPAAGSPVTKDDIRVDNVVVEVGRGSPIPVHAVVSGSLPGTCAQLGEIRLHREGTTFYVRLIAYSQQSNSCVQDSLPFRLEVPLSTVNLPEGPYEVIVNGASTSFDPYAANNPGSGLDEFTSRLQEALSQGDGPALQSMMGESLLIGLWRSEAVAYPPAEAVEQLLSNLPGPGKALSFQDFTARPDLDPQALVGPQVEVAKTLLVSGWGKDGDGEALLMIAGSEDGTYYWHSVLAAPEGFSPLAGAGGCSEPVALPVLDGMVSFNGVTFRLDPALGQNVSATTCPEVLYSPEQAPGEAHPPYTGFFFPDYRRVNVDSAPEVRVYELTGDLSQYPFPLNQITELNSFLELQSESASWFEASPLHVQQKYLAFGNGNGVRSLVQYMHDVFFFTNNGLLYEFHGLTDDGTRFVSVRYPVSVPFLMELSDGTALPTENVNQDAIPVNAWPEDYAAQREVIEAYNKEALDRLRIMPPSEASPDITLLDALITSLQVERTSGSTE